MADDAVFRFGTNLPEVRREVETELAAIQRRVQEGVKLPKGGENALEGLTRGLADTVSRTGQATQDLASDFARVQQKAQQTGQSITEALRDARKAQEVPTGSFSTNALDRYKNALKELEALRTKAMANPELQGLNLEPLIRGAIQQLRSQVETIYREAQARLNTAYGAGNRTVGDVPSSRFSSMAQSAEDRTGAAARLTREQTAILEQQNADLDAARSQKKRDEDEIAAGYREIKASVRRQQKAERDKAAEAEEKKKNIRQALALTTVSEGFGRRYGDNVVTGQGEGRQVIDLNTGEEQANYKRRETALLDDTAAMERKLAADKKAAAASEQVATGAEAQAALAKRIALNQARYVDRSRRFIEEGDLGSGNYSKVTTKGVENIHPDSLDYQNAKRSADAEAQRAARQQKRIADAMERQADQINSKGVLQNFLGGATSRGFAGGQKGFQGSFDGLAQAAGVSVKYATIGAAIYTVTAAMKQASQEYLDFVDSNTELKIALGTSDNVGQDFVSTLTDISRVAGSNVGESMDVAAAGMRAFGDTTKDSKEQLEQIGASFAKQAGVMAVLAKTDLTDAAGNIKAIGNAFDVDPSGFARINDAIAGAKKLAGGDEKQIAQGLTSIGVAADAAGFSLNETAAIISKVQALTDESGSAVATRLSKVFAIVGGSQGKAAINRLNSSLTPDQQIDTSGTATLRDQLGQLAKVYGTLGESQRQQLVNSLGGTANTRELITLLENYNQVMSEAGDSTNFAGKGAAEFNRRLSDLTGILRKITGDLKAIATAVGQSGLFAPLILGIEAAEPALNLVREILEMFNRVPLAARTAAFGILEVVAAVKLFGAIKNAGGFSNLLIQTESSVAPGRAVARNSLAKAKNEAIAGGVTALSPGLSSRYEAKLWAASKALDDAAEEAKAVQRKVMDTTRDSAKALSDARRYLEQAAPEHRADAQAAVNRAEATHQGDLVAGAQQAEQARADLRAAQAAKDAAEKEQRTARKVLDPADERFTSTVAASQGRRTAAADAVDNATTLTGLNDAIIERIAVEERENLVIAEATKARALAEESALTQGSGPSRLDRTRARLRPGSEISFKGVLAYDEEAKAGAVALRESNKELGGFRRAMSQARYALNNGALGRGINEAGVDGPSKVGNIVGRGIKGVGDVARSEIGTLGTALIGFQAVMSTWSTNNRINDALKGASSLQGGVGLGSSPADLRASADKLSAASAALRQSSGGFLGTIVNGLRGNPTGKTADDLDASAARAKETADRVDKIRSDAARSNDNPAGVFDFGAEGGVAAGLKALADGGRNATTQLDALFTALRNVGNGAGDAARKLNPAQKQTYGIELGQKIMDDIAGGIEIGEGKTSGTKKVIETLSRFGGVQGWLLNKATGTPQGEKDADGIRKLMKDGSLQKDLESTTSGFINDGGDPLTADGKKQLAELIRRRLTDRLKDVDISPEAKKAIIASAIRAISLENNDIATLGNADVTADEALQAGIPAVQAEAQRQAMLAANNGAIGGGTLAGAQRQADKMRELRGILAAKKDVKPGQLEAIDDAIMQADQAVAAAAQAYQQSLANLAKSLLPSTDASGRIAADIASTTEQLNSTTDDKERTDLQAKLNDLYQQQAQQAVRDGNARRSLIGDTRDKMQTAANDLNNAADNVNQIAASGDTTSEAYSNALLDYRRKLQAYLDVQVSQTNDFNTANTDPRDSVAGAITAATNAYNTAASQLQGTPEAALAWQAYNEAQRKVVDATVKRDNAKMIANVDPRDNVGKAAAELRAAQTVLANMKKTDDGYWEQYGEVQAKKYELAKAQVDDYNKSFDANTDPRDTQQVAQNNIYKAMNNRALTKPGTVDRDMADREVANARLAKQQADVAVANARQSANAFIGSDLSVAQANLANATRDLRLTRKNSEDYWAKLGAFRQAQESLAEAEAKAAQNAYLLTIDLTDPLAQAQATLKAANDKLAADIKRKAPKDVLDADKLDVKNAENQQEAAAFQQRFSDAQIADQLGRTSHQAYLQYLNNEHERLSAITNRTRQQQDELDQIDGALKSAKDNLNSAMSGQFNLGDIKVPTVYEMRRSLAIDGGQTGGLAAGSSGNTTNSNNTVYINGADFAKVVEYLEYALGQSAQVTRTTGGRKV